MFQDSGNSGTGPFYGRTLFSSRARGRGHFAASRMSAWNRGGGGRASRQAAERRPRSEKSNEEIRRELLRLSGRRRESGAVGRGLAALLRAGSRRGRLRRSRRASGNRRKVAGATCGASDNGRLDSEQYDLFPSDRRRGDDGGAELSRQGGACMGEAPSARSMVSVLFLYGRRGIYGAVFFRAQRRAECRDGGSGGGRQPRHLYS